MTKEDRRADILRHAKDLLLKHGFAKVEMEDVRNSCGISRGGLYHHFQNKRAILDALVATEVAQLTHVLKEAGASPIQALLHAGSHHLGADTGILASLSSSEEMADYLSAFDMAMVDQLLPVLRNKLAVLVRPDVDPAHVAELFLTVNAHINRRTLLGDWGSANAAGFAATALKALAPLLTDTSGISPIIKELEAKAASK